MRSEEKSDLRSKVKFSVGNSQDSPDKIAIYEEEFGNIEVQLRSFGGKRRIVRP